MDMSVEREITPMNAGEIGFYYLCSHVIVKNDNQSAEKSIMSLLSKSAMSHIIASVSLKLLKSDNQSVYKSI